MNVENVVVFTTMYLVTSISACMVKSGARAKHVIHAESAVYLHCS